MKAFQHLQRRFAAHVRDPRRSAPGNLAPRRMRIYAELYFNNIEGALASAFPVIREILAGPRWRGLVRDFCTRHLSREPLLQRLGGEFVEFLRTPARVRKDPVWLRELAHYEWAELALATSTDDINPALADRRGNLLTGVPVLSPLVWSLRYGYAVHRIAPGRLPKGPAAAPVHLVVWRDRGDEVHFMESNAVTARLLELMRERPATGHALLARIVRELKHPEPALVMRDGAAIFKALAARDIVLGAKPDKSRNRR